MSPVYKLQGQGQTAARAAMTQLNLSARAYHRTQSVKLARTISDLGYAMMLAAAQVAFKRSGKFMEPLYRIEQERAENKIREVLNAQDFSKFLEEGHAVTVEQAISLALEPGQITKVKRLFATNGNEEPIQHPSSHNAK